MRVAAFVSGGLIPTHLRGSSSNIRFHIVDWYCSWIVKKEYGYPHGIVLTMPRWHLIASATLLTLS